VKLYYILLLIFLFISSSILRAQDDEVSEFKKYKVDNVKIDFKGTKTFSKGEIEDLIRTPKMDVFDRDEYIVDMQRIEKFYFDNGFIDAVVDTSTVVDKEDSEIEANFTIEEREPYRIKTITYRGLGNIGDVVWNKIFKENEPLIDTGEIYNKNKLNQEIVRISNLLTNNGFANAYANSPEIIKIESQDNYRAHQLDLVLDFYSGDRYRFGKTSINLQKDKYKISDRVLLVELEYNELDIYSKEKLIESENRLSKIAILDNARIQIDNVDTVNNIINLKIVGSVKNKYVLQPELLGYDIQNQFYAGTGVSFSDKYFIGGGRTSTVRARILAHSKDLYGFELTGQIYQPAIFNNNKITGEMKLSGQLYSDIIYWISEVKDQFSFNYELPKHTYVNNLVLDWKISNQRFTVKSGTAQVDTSLTLPENSFLNIFSSVLGLSVIHNNTNNFAFPTKGFYQSFLVEHSGLLGNLVREVFDISTFSYIKLSSVNKIFLNLSDDASSSVLAYKFLIGSIFEYGDNTLKVNVNGVRQDVDVNIIPIESRFIAGGSTSVRGWGSRKLGTFPNKENGGNFIIESNIEHRTKPFIDTKGYFKDLGFVTFLDFGNLWESPKKFTFGDIAVAIGAGVRYYTIVGPIRFDIGFKLYDYAPDPGTDKWLFKNSFDTIFKNKLTIQFGIGNTF
jgi:outer membrane protein insertion porin family